MERIVPFGGRLIEHVGPGPGHFWLSHLADLLFLAVLVAGAVLIVRMIINRPQAQHAGPAISEKPLQILEERFARGEIDEEEFRTRREALRS